MKITVAGFLIVTGSVLLIVLFLNAFRGNEGEAQ
jgi:hypothetical protein